jgi:molybdopterin-guanine dinucleotide biosynthesis protein MobB
VAATRIISIVGRKGAGKTTLLVALAAEFSRRKQRVMTIKHSTTAELDQRGKDDTWRHRHEGKAERVLLECPGERRVFERTREESDPISLAQRYLDGADIVLVEGFERAPLPKIEVYRLVAGKTPLFDSAASDSTDWVAMVTDDVAYRAVFPVLRFNDTAWLVTLANLAWDRARIITP